MVQASISCAENKIVSATGDEVVIYFDSDIKALADSVSMHYRSTNRALVSFIVALLFVMSAQIGSEEISFLTVSFSYDVFVPIVIISLSVLAYIYCQWFNMSFRAAQFFIELVAEREKALPQEEKERFRHMCHLLYHSTPFRVFPVMHGIRIPLLKRTGTENLTFAMTKISSFILVYFPIVSILFVILAFYRDISFVKLVLIMPFLILACLGSFALAARVQVFSLLRRRDTERDGS